MKNLKKVLSLGLALSIALSLMTVAFAADASDFKDYDDVTYNEAVDVMVAAGVFNGVEGNKFAPEGTLTREMAAKIITYMMLGEEKADKLTTTVAPYADVAAGRWSAGAIAYCSNEGILAGVGGGKFAPTRELTGLEFAKMVLCALGFDATENGLEGSSWAINASKLAIKEELDENLEDISLSKVLTREQACQMALNGMKWTSSKDIYRVTNKVDSYDFDNMNDALLYATLMNSNKGETDPKWDVVKTKDYSDALIADVFDIAVKDDTDAFGRPSTTYTHKDWNGDLVYADKADYSFVISEATTLADLLKDNNLTRKVLGASEDQLATDYAIGDVVELYVDKDKKLTNLVSYAYGLYEITDVDECDAKADKRAIEDGAKYVVTLKDSDGASEDYYDIELNGFDVNGYVKDAMIVAAVNGDGDLIIDDYSVDGYDVVAFSDVADSVEGKVNGTGDDYIRVEGNKYTVADGVTAELNGKYTFYQDPNGIVIGSEVIDDAATINDVRYVVETYTTTDTSDYGVKTTNVYAQTVKLDGSVENILVGTQKAGGTQYGLSADAAKDLKGNLYTAKYYSSEKKIDSVTYKKCNAMNAWPKDSDDKNFVGTIAEDTVIKSDDNKVAATIENANSVRLNNSTTYITIEESLGDIEVAVKTGGVKTTLAEEGTVIATKTTGNYVANYVILPGSTVKTSYSDVIYVPADPDLESVTVGADEKSCVKYTVYTEDGKEKEITVEGDAAGDAGFYTYEIDEDGIYTLESIDNLNDKLTAAYEDESGMISGKFASYYGTLLTLDVEHMTDIETANAKILDIHDTDAEGQYGKTIKDLDGMKAAVDAKVKDDKGEVQADKAYSVDLKIYANDGAVLIVVTSVAADDK